MAAFEGESTVPPQVFEGNESVSIIVQGGELAQPAPSEAKPLVITNKNRVIRK